MRNIGSEFVKASEVIDTLVTVSVQKFYELDFKKAPTNSSTPDVSMQVIHVYLDSHVNILFKKFVFLHTIMQTVIGGDGLQLIHGNT